MSQPDQTTGGALQRSDREPRIAILVLGCLLTIYDRCIRTIRATWGSQSRSHVDIFYVYGGQHTNTDEEIIDIERLIGQPQPQLQDFEVWVSGDIILCGAADLYVAQQDCVLRKRLIAFDYLANQQRYDFIYTVCATSYVDVEALQQYVSILPSSGVYHGPLGIHQSSGYPFVSGASILLSRDIAADLANSAEAIIAANAIAAPDDVAIGHWIASTYCAESAAEISGRIAAEIKATNNQTFVLPYGKGMIDFVMSPAYSHVPQEHAYHYHFHSRRTWEMENFHRRFFATQVNS